MAICSFLIFVFELRLSWLVREPSFEPYTAIAFSRLLFLYIIVNSIYHSLMTLAVEFVRLLLSKSHKGPTRFRQWNRSSPGNAHFINDFKADKLIVVSRRGRNLFLKFQKCARTIVSTYDRIAHLRLPAQRVATFPLLCFLFFLNSHVLWYILIECCHLKGSHNTRLRFSFEEKAVVFRSRKHKILAATRLLRIAFGGKGARFSFRMNGWMNEWNSHVRTL